MVEKFDFSYKQKLVEGSSIVSHLHPTYTEIPDSVSPMSQIEHTAHSSSLIRPGTSAFFSNMKHISFSNIISQTRRIFWSLVARADKNNNKTILGK